MRTQSKAAHLEYQVPKQVSEIFADTFGNGREMVSGAAPCRALVKAAGGIRTPEQAWEMLDAGASIIGTSTTSIWADTRCRQSPPAARHTRPTRLPGRPGSRAQP